jgi:hypothetical protein
MARVVTLINKYIITQEPDEPDEEFEEMVEDFKNGSSYASNGVSIDGFYDSAVIESDTK